MTLSDEIERVASALERQCGNMAFVLHFDVPPNWYRKLSGVLSDSHDTECSPTTGETGAAVTGPATINLEATSEPDAAIVLNKRDRLRRPANFKSATISMDWEANDD